MRTGLITIFYALLLRGIVYTVHPLLLQKHSSLGYPLNLLLMVWVATKASGLGSINLGDGYVVA